MMKLIQIDEAWIVSWADSWQDFYLNKLFKGGIYKRNKTLQSRSTGTERGKSKCGSQFDNLNFYFKFEKSLQHFSMNLI